MGIWSLLTVESVHLVLLQLVPNSIPIFDLLEKRQCYQLYAYEEDEAYCFVANGDNCDGCVRRDAITNSTLADFRRPN
jgi:hypothetical protein